MLGATWTASRCSSAGGDGSFRPKTDYGKTKDPELPAYFFSSVALGDLNGDRKLDIVNKFCVRRRSAQPDARMSAAMDADGT